jgi:hypothetical protein
VNGIRPIAVLQQEHLERRRVIRVLEQAEGVPLLVVYPRDVDIRVAPPRCRQIAESVRYPHRYTNAGRQDVEGARIDLLAHVKVHVAGIDSVQYDERTKDGGYEPAVGDGFRGDVDGEEIE